MQDEANLLDLSKRSTYDLDVIASMEKGDHLMMRDGKFALMDTPTFEAAIVKAMNAATQSIMRALSITWKDVADVRPVWSRPPFDRVTASMTLRDGRQATATASVWTGRIILGSAT